MKLVRLLGVQEVNQEDCSITQYSNQKSDSLAKSTLSAICILAQDSCLARSMWVWTQVVCT